MRIQQSALSAAAMAMFFVLSSCTPEPATRSDASPQRIVSMSPGLTETVCALGCGDRLVGVTNYCKYPPRALELAKVGGYLDPSLEAVVALEPDLVLVMESQGSFGAHLKSIGIRVVQIDQHDVKAILESFAEVGALCGRSDRGKELRHEVNERLERVKNLIGERAPPRVLAVIGRNVGAGDVTSVWAAADSTFFGDVVALAGGRNVLTQGIEGAYPEISREGLIHLDPDVILDVVPAEQAGQRLTETIVSDWKNLGVLRAVASGRLYVLRQPFIVVPGPRVAEVVEAVARELHPEAPW